MENLNCYSKHSRNDFDIKEEQLNRDNLTYSHILQDVMALMVNDYKFNGNCIDIGCQSPNRINNTVLLQLFNWKSINIDIGRYENDWLAMENADFHNMDMTVKENVDTIMNLAPNIVDFLSIDIDDYCLDCLKLIDLEKTRFRCICIEHNKYTNLIHNKKEQRHEQREILKKAGYVLLVKNVAPNNQQCEDWWVDPNLVNIESFKYLEGLECDFQILNYWYEMDKFAPNHEEKINNARPNFHKQTLEKLNSIYA
jgi:hypothetical protein